MDNPVQPGQRQSKLHYYSDPLKKKLSDLATAPVAIIEAPAGYGKTSVMRDYLKTEAARDAQICWFTAVEEEPRALYQRFCREIEKFDEPRGKRLLEIDFPTTSTIGQACDALRGLNCAHECWCVIDNFQFLRSTLPATFLTTLLEQESTSLHIVILTQLLGRNLLSALKGRDILYIGVADLCLDAHDIRRYFALGGAHISDAQADQIFNLTDGWIGAIYLQLCAYQETGAFSGLAIQQLMERMIWNKLSADQQTFLLRISPFKRLSPQQMCDLLGCASLPDYAQDCLCEPFIKYDPRLHLYELHDTLRELLANKRAERNSAFEQECWTAAGDLCRAEGEVAEALGFYARVKDYERMLSLDLSHLIYTEIDGRMFFDVATELAHHCPANIKAAHPLALMSAAWAIKAAGNQRLFEELLDELDGFLPKSGALRADWTLLSSYRQFPHLDKMTPLLQEAKRLFKGGSSQVILPDAPWAFGNYSQLCEFHLTPGKADQEADALESFIALHAQLTGGQGTGADALFRAELAFMRGDLENAEIGAYKALFQASSKQQTAIQIGAITALANAAVFKNNTEGWQNAMSSLEQMAARAARGSFPQLILETGRGMFLKKLGAPQHIADWLEDGNLSNPLLINSLYTNALYAYAYFLIRQKEFTRLIGRLEAEPVEVSEKSTYAAFTYAILLAVGYASLDDYDKASALLERAAELAMPDGLLIHFVTLPPSLDSCVNALMSKYPKYAESYRSAKAQFAISWETLRSTSVTDAALPLLTVREYEIAVLAAEGLHNDEIAQRLFVSVSTVRTHLRAVFHKLGVDRRAALAEKLEESPPPLQP